MLRNFDLLSPEKLLLTAFFRKLKEQTLANYEGLKPPQPPSFDRPNYLRFLDMTQPDLWFDFPDEEIKLSISRYTTMGNVSLCMGVTDLQVCQN